MTCVGIIGGSGLYDLAGVADLREERVSTPFGEPSAPPVRGRLGDTDLVFVPRHGRGHVLLPSEINYRANIHALKQLGATRLISVSAVGSMREGIAPGDVVLADQFIDKTHRRVSTFFGEGVAGHVSFADPVCPELAGVLERAALASGLGDGGKVDRAKHRGRGAPPFVHRGGTYVCMEGPQFSTRAESLLHRNWGVDVIGMTAVTEAKLAREAELCFGLVALSTDYDCWHPEEEAVTASSVVEVVRQNVARAKAILRAALATVPAARNCACGHAAEHAIMTDRATIDAGAKARLATLWGAYLETR